MLIKILFTCAIIVGVVIFFRHKQSIANPNVTTEPDRTEQDRSIAARRLAYGVVGMLVVGSVLWAIFFEVNS